MVYYCKDKNMVCIEGCEKGIEIEKGSIRATAYDEITRAIGCSACFIYHLNGSVEQVDEFVIVQKCDNKTGVK